MASSLVLALECQNSLDMFKITFGTFNLSMISNNFILWFASMSNCFSNISNKNMTCYSAWSLIPLNMSILDVTQNEHSILHSILMNIKIMKAYLLL